MREGFDVWLGATRGSFYSREHQWLDPDKDVDQYWDFDWEQMGDYDLPAFIERIRLESGFEKVAYIGFS